MGENLRNKRLYKVELLLLKVLPMLIALCYALNSLLSYFDIDLEARHGEHEEYEDDEYAYSERGYRGGNSARMMRGRYGYSRR